MFAGIYFTKFCEKYLLVNFNKNPQNVETVLKLENRYNRYLHLNGIEFQQKLIGIKCKGPSQ